MSTALSTAPVRSADEKKAYIMLGDEQIGVRVGPDGFLRRVYRRVQLEYGTDIYAPKPSPSANDKCSPFQPGYMKLVHAMGGTLVCPPAVRDPVTGQMRPNPEVECYPGTNTIRSVTATAVCAVRNPLTGLWHVSVQTIRQDAELVLVQALMKLEREDATKYTTTERWEAMRLTEAADGWLPLNIGAGVVLLANMRLPAVREALATMKQQSATLRQRACSKAERLAADHNPVTRRTWYYGALKRRMSNGSEGEYESGPRYVEVDCVAWVESAGQAEIERFVASFADGSAASVTAEIVSGFHADDDGEPDDDLEEGYVAPTPQLTERMEAEIIPASQAVRAQRVESAPVAAPAAAPPPAAPPGGNGKRGRLAKSWIEVPDELRPDMLRKVGAAPNAELSALSDGQVSALLDVVTSYLGVA